MGHVLDKRPPGETRSVNRRSPRLARSCFATLLAGTLALTLAGPSHAAEELTGSGIKPDDPAEILANKPKADAIMQLYALYDEREKPSLTAAEVKSVEARIVKVQTRVEKLSGTPIEKIAPEPLVMALPKTASAARSAAAALAAVPTSKALAFTHRTQSNEFYCGPASTMMGLDAMGASSTSLFNGVAMSQVNLAAYQYLQTVEAPGGGTSMGRVAVTYDKWAGVPVTYQTTLDRPGLKSLVRRSNGQYGRALIYGTRENDDSSRPAYNNHYDYFVIDHIIMGYGYEQNGDRLLYADPVYGRWPQVNNGRQGMATERMATYQEHYGTVG